jgi:hypothetical protein
MYLLHADFFAAVAATWSVTLPTGGLPLSSVGHITQLAGRIRRC